MHVCSIGLHLASFNGFSCWKSLSPSAGSKLSHGQLRIGALLLSLTALELDTLRNKLMVYVGGRIWKEAQSLCLCCCAGAAL